MSVAVEVEEAGWAQILKWSCSPGHYRPEEAGRPDSLHSPSLDPNQVNGTSLPHLLQPLGAIQEEEHAIYHLGARCVHSCTSTTVGPAADGTASHKLFSLRLREAEKRICSEVQVIIKTQPVSSECLRCVPHGYFPL